MKTIIRQCVLIALIGLSLGMIFDIPPESLSLEAAVIRAVVFKTFGILTFSLAIKIDRLWRKTTTSNH